MAAQEDLLQPVMQDKRGGSTLASRMTSSRRQLPFLGHRTDL